MRYLLITLLNKQTSEIERTILKDFEKVKKNKNLTTKLLKINFISNGLKVWILKYTYES